MSPCLDPAELLPTICAHKGALPTPKIYQLYSNSNTSCYWHHHLKLLPPSSYHLRITASLSPAGTMIAIDDPPTLSDSFSSLPEDIHIRIASYCDEATHSTLLGCASGFKLRASLTYGACLVNKMPVLSQPPNSDPKSLQSAMDEDHRQCAIQNERSQLRAVLLAMKWIPGRQERMVGLDIGLGEHSSSILEKLLRWSRSRLRSLVLREVLSDVPYRRLHIFSFSINHLADRLGSPSQTDTTCLISLPSLARWIAYRSSATARSGTLLYSLLWESIRRSNVRRSSDGLTGSSTQTSGALDLRYGIRGRLLLPRGDLLSRGGKVTLTQDINHSSLPTVQGVLRETRGEFAMILHADISIVPITSCLSSVRVCFHSAESDKHRTADIDAISSQPPRQRLLQDTFSTNTSVPKCAYDRVLSPIRCRRPVTTSGSLV